MASLAAGRTLFGWIAIAGAAALLLLALAWLEGGPGPVREPEQQVMRSSRTAGLANNYEQALAAANLHVASAGERAAASDDEWLLHETAARAYLFRARLTGSYSDYFAAERELRRAESMAVPGTGPHMTGAM